MNDMIEIQFNSKKNSCRLGNTELILISEKKDNGYWAFQDKKTNPHEKLIFQAKTNLGNKKKIPDRLCFDYICDEQWMTRMTIPRYDPKTVYKVCFSIDVQKVIE